MERKHLVYLTKTVGFLSLTLFESSIHPYVQWPFNLPPNFLLVIQDILPWSFCLSAHLPLEIDTVLSIPDPVLSLPGSSVSFCPVLAVSGKRGQVGVSCLDTEAREGSPCSSSLGSHVLRLQVLSSERSWAGC